MRASFGAPLAGLGLMLAAFTLAYFLASAGSGPLTGRLGTSDLLLGGCALSTAAWLSIALAPQWWLVPMVSVLAGAGSGLIDASVNAHITLNRGVRYMGWLHAAWAAGAALGPPVVVLSLAVTGSWRAGFAAMGAAFLVIGLLVSARRRDWIAAAVGPTAPAPIEAPGRTNYRRAMLILAGLFLVAAGLEATAGDWAYTQLTLGRAVSNGLAGWGVTLFWAGLAAGRVALGLVGSHVQPVRLLDAGIGISVLATLAFWLAPPLVSALIALPMLGVALSVIFPLLLSLTPSRVGAGMTAHAVGYGLAAGTIGGGGVPATVGLALQSLGLSTLGPLLSVLAMVLALLHAISCRDSRRSAQPGLGGPAL
ncbi:MAG: MFS transporter [Chloroflexi bacterium]|nr:MAG: MFS transporter [Chloroflexota bacterium]